MTDLIQLGETIAQVQNRAVQNHAVTLGELALQTTPEHVINLLTFLRDDERCQFHNFISICGADYPAREKRFDVIYQLQSLTLNQRVRIKLQADENTPVPSACAVFPGALWFERETYDMYGVKFEGHPDLRRLLTDYEFEGWPLRKDFPLTGFKEVRYDDSKKRVVYKPVRLQQEFRDFDFASPWEGPDYLGENPQLTHKRQGS
jgi:NADH-quinone oxidoreductase subunit C